MKLSDIALREQRWPARATQFANCFHNQLELPVLFYAVVAFILITSTNSSCSCCSPGSSSLARLVHAYIHTGANDVAQRSYAMAASAIALFADVADLRRAHPHPRRPDRCAQARGWRPRPKSSTTSSTATARLPTALADWGKAHRFAGSGDRAAIGTLVYDALRRRASIAAQHGSRYAARAGARRRACAPSRCRADEVAAAADGSEHALAPLDRGRAARLARDLPADAPRARRRRLPRMAAPSFERAFGARAAEEGAGLSARAPVDLRVNTLKATREKVLKALARFGPEPTPLSPVGVRMPAPEGAGRAPAPRGGGGARQGLVRGAGRGLAGRGAAGGRRPAHAGARSLRGGRRQDAGARRGDAEHGPDLRLRRRQAAAAADLRAVEAGGRAQRAGAWMRATRRRCWRWARASTWCSSTPPARAPARGGASPIRNGASSRRTSRSGRPSSARRSTWARGSSSPAGALVYVTCSVLPEENADQVAAFLDEHADFALVPYAGAWRERLGSEPPDSADGRDRHAATDSGASRHRRLLHRAHAPARCLRGSTTRQRRGGKLQDGTCKVAKEK